MSDFLKIVAGNWKMHKSRKEVESFFSELSSASNTQSVRKIVAASPTLLESALKFSANKNVEIFAQNCHGETQGAFTGETSPAQLKDLGIKGSLVGHSERRQYFGETDESCNKRTLGLWNNELEVIYCIGEKLSERESHKTSQVLKSQLKELIQNYKQRLSENKYCQLIVAYEPVWAIGTGLTAESAQIVDAHKLIKEEFKAAGIAPNRIPPVLYGGSVKTNNFNEISSLSNVDGGLIGGASLKASDYNLLCQAAAK